MNRDILDNIVGFEARIRAYGLLLSSGISSTEPVGFQARNMANNALVGFETRNWCAFGHGDSGISGTELAGFQAPNNARLVGFKTQKDLLTSRIRESFRCVTLVLNNSTKDQQQKSGYYCSFFSKGSHDKC